MFNVFQIELNDAMYNEVNSHPDSWNGVKWGKTYCDLTFGSWHSEEELVVLVRRAMLFGLVKHTMTVDCEELEQVYALGNGMGDQARVTNHMRHKSVSVGDIVLRTDLRGGAVVARMGFTLIGEQFTREIESVVSDTYYGEEV
jgi:hypothetical protein